MSMDREEKAFLEDSLRKIYARGFAHKANPMLFRNRDAEGIVRTLGYVPNEEPALLDCCLEGLREELAAESARSFLRRHPFGLVVLYECGLDLPFAMFDNGRCRCLCIDNADHLEVRDALIPERVRETRTGCDTAGNGWIEEAEAMNISPILVIAGDRFLTRSEREVKSLVDMLARRLHEGGIFLEYRRNTDLFPYRREEKDDAPWRVKDPARELPYYSAYIRSCERITHLPEGWLRLLPAAEGRMLEKMLGKEQPGFVNLLFE